MRNWCFTSYYRYQVVGQSSAICDVAQNLFTSIP